MSIFDIDYTLAQWIMLCLACLLIGAAKAGLKGLGIIVVAIFVQVMGAKPSTGAVLPLLLLGDILAVVYYRRSAKWSYVRYFLPAMIVGIIGAVLIGERLSPHGFRYCMGSVIMTGVLVMFWYEWRGLTASLHGMKWSIGTGLAAGFATMIGNLAGPFANLFFLGSGLTKKEIIGTGAWLFLLINLFKVPFHIWSWHTIDSTSIQLNVILTPIVFLGFYLGFIVVRWISESWYRYFLLAATALGGLSIFL